MQRLFLAMFAILATSIAAAQVTQTFGASGYTPLFGTSASLGGVALTSGTCTTASATVAGAVAGRPVTASPSTGTAPGLTLIWFAQVTAANTVTVSLCAVATVTPAAQAYNVVVFP